MLPVLLKAANEGLGKSIGMFSPPKYEAEFAKWQSALDGLTKKPLKYSSVVCEKHYDEEGVDSCYAASLPDGVTIY